GTGHGPYRARRRGAGPVGGVVPRRDPRQEDVGRADPADRVRSRQPADAEREGAERGRRDGDSRQPRPADLQGAHRRWPVTTFTFADVRKSAWDTETTGPNPLEDRIVTAAFIVRT